MLSGAVRVLYRRNPFLEAVPWLMLASALRFYGYFSGGVVSLVATGLSNLAVFLAFLLAARRMIEWTGGSVRFGALPIRDQLRLGQQILNRVLVLLFGLFALAMLLGFKQQALHFMLGFDGIAFDQHTWTGMVWSATLAATVYLMLLDAEQYGKPSLPRAAMAGFRNWRWILPAILLVALADIAISVAQGQLRGLVTMMWANGVAPIGIMKAIYFTFVFGFATLRLWVTLAILTCVIREGYRLNPSPGTPPAIN
jgi:hypothetical protein